MGDFNSPGVLDGRKTDCLSSHPTADLEPVVSLKSPSSGRGDPAVNQDQFEPVGDALPGQMLQHQLTCPILVG